MCLVRVLKIKEEEGLFDFIFFIENGAKFPVSRPLCLVLAYNLKKEEALFI